MPNLSRSINRIRENILFELVFSALAVISVSLLVYELLADLSEDRLRATIRVDFWIAILFLSDFFAGLAAADDRKDYFKGNWYMLLASIPVNEYLFRSLRALRIIRVLRIMRFGSSISRTLYLREYLPGWWQKIKQRFFK